MKAFWLLFWQRTPEPKPTGDEQARSQYPFNNTYQALSSASVETLWQMLSQKF
ncbi:MAG: hypothetical protein F6K42_17715 [Leptolyngbya sp. SIO1D8]|nr:hypothetical protein [Leptolyngbya sp. SIO1D8]